MQDIVQIVAPDDPMIARLLNRALRAPLDNCFMVADLTQSRHDCTIAGLIRDGDPVAAACFYRDLPFAAIALMADSVWDARAVVEKLAEVHPVLARGPIYDFYPKRVAGLIREAFRVVAVDTEYQMVLRNPAPRAAIDPHYKIRRLAMSDLPAAEALFRLVPVMAWTPKAFGFGPFFGAFRDGELVSIAGVHFAVPELAEIGNVATHPKHRGKNLAGACTRRVIEDVRDTSRVIFLCVKAENAGAFELYKRMGFAVHQELEIIGFHI